MVKPRRLSHSIALALSSLCLALTSLPLWAAGMCSYEISYTSAQAFHRGIIREPKNDYWSDLYLVGNQDGTYFNFAYCTNHVAPQERDLTDFPAFDPQNTKNGCRPILFPDVLDQFQLRDPLRPILGTVVDGYTCGPLSDCTNPSERQRPEYDLHQSQSSDFQDRLLQLIDEEIQSIYENYRTGENSLVARVYANQDIVPLAVVAEIASLIWFGYSVRPTFRALKGRFFTKPANSPPEDISKPKSGRLRRYTGKALSFVGGSAQLFFAASTTAYVNIFIWDKLTAEVDAENMSTFYKQQITELENFAFQMGITDITNALEQSHPMLNSLSQDAPKRMMRLLIQAYAETLAKACAIEDHLPNQN